MRCVSVVVADCHPVVLKGLTSILGPGSGFKVVASCRDGPSFVDAIRRFMPEIGVLEVSLPGLTGLEVLALANSEKLPTRLVFFTASVQDRQLVAPAPTGAYGVLQKDVAPEILVQFLRQVADCQRLVASAVREQRNVAITENVPPLLTDRERQIMTLVSDGLSNKEIARRLNIADGTIKVHLHHIFQKLEISNRTVLAALALSLNDNLTLVPRVIPRARSDERQSP
jgi:two-component system nitrate/nitrite response regulator NarL